MKRFAAAHGLQAMILGIGALGIVVGGFFFFGGNAFGLKAEPKDSGDAAQVEQSDSVASIKSQDSDKDGLSDLDERLYRSDPTKPDTDGDGFKDGEEVANGYDPTSKLSAGEGVNPKASSAKSADAGSLLGFMGYGKQGTGATSGTGVGGLGGFTPDQLEMLGKQTLPDGQRIAELEVDQVLTNASQPLPSVDQSKIKTNNETSLEAERKHISAVYEIAFQNNPFPAGYSFKEYFSDVEANNRDLFERMKLSAETVYSQMSELTVPKSLLEEHAHALSILLAAKEALQKVLDSDGSPDTIIDLLGRSFFVTSEIGALLQDVSTEVPL